MILKPDELPQGVFEQYFLIIYYILSLRNGKITNKNSHFTKLEKIVTALPSLFGVKKMIVGGV